MGVFGKIIKKKIHTLDVNLELGNGERIRGQVKYRIDWFGRAMILADGPVTREIDKKYRGTLMEAILILDTEKKLNVTHTDLGDRLVNVQGEFVQYHFSLTLNGGAEGIPFRENKLTGQRTYFDLRNILLSKTLAGSSLKATISAEGCDLRNSNASEEVTRRFRSFQIYNLDGSETLAYNNAEPTRIDKKPNHEFDAYRRDAWQRIFFFRQPHSTFSYSFRDFSPSESPSWEGVPPLVAGGIQGESRGKPPAFNGNPPVSPIQIQYRAALPSLGANAQEIPGRSSGGMPLEISNEPDEIRSPIQNEDGARHEEKAKESPHPVQLSQIKSFGAAIFDLDGVIVDSERAHLDSFNQTLAPLGIRVDEQTWRHKYTGVGSFAIMSDLFAKHGIRADSRAWVQARAKAYALHIGQNKLPEIEGFRKAYLFLVKNGIKVAVASGGHREHVAETLRSIGLPNMAFVALEDVKNRKPAPDLFLLAAKRLGVKPSECIVFEDALSGIKAAEAAGMPCIALSTTLPAEKLSGKAALIVNDFNSNSLKNALAILVSTRKAAVKAKGIPEKKRVCKAGDAPSLNAGKKPSWFAQSREMPSTKGRVVASWAVRRRAKNSARVAVVPSWMVGLKGQKADAAQNPAEKSGIQSKGEEIAPWAVRPKEKQKANPFNWLAAISSKKDSGKKPKGKKKLRLKGGRRKP